MNITLIGGVGQIGYGFAQYLINNGHAVTVTSRREQNERLFDPLPCRIVTAQMYPNDDGLISAIKGSDMVIHLAGENTRPVLEALKIHAPQTPFMYISTFHVYGTDAGEITESTPTAPISIYGQTRLKEEEVVREFAAGGIKALVVRLGNTFGSSKRKRDDYWKLVVHDYALQAAQTQKIRVRNSETQRSFISLDDTYVALELLAQEPWRWPENGIINVGMTVYTMIQMAHKVAGLYQFDMLKECKIESEPEEKKPRLEYGQAFDCFWKTSKRNPRWEGITNPIREVIMDACFR